MLRMIGEKKKKTESGIFQRALDITEKGLRGQF